jgi:PAS domain S-box-containing protein
MVGEPLPSIYESILKRKDGSGFFAELNAGIITYDGRPADLIIVRDINDRKNMEMALREQSFDAIVIHKDRKIAFLNKKATKILGAAEPEDLMGRSIYDFIHPDSLQDLEARLRKLSTIPGTPVPVLIMKFFRVDRKIVTAEVMAMSFIDNGIPAVRVTFREIASP